MRSSDPTGEGAVGARQGHVEISYAIGRNLQSVLAGSSRQQIVRELLARRVGLAAHARPIGRVLAQLREKSLCEWQHRLDAGPNEIGSGCGHVTPPG
jgi:hypothetical protein